MSDRSQTSSPKDQTDMSQNDIEIKEVDIPIIDLTQEDTDMATISAPPVMYIKKEVGDSDYKIRSYSTIGASECNPAMSNTSSTRPPSHSLMMDCSKVDHGSLTKMDGVNCYHDVEIIRKSFPGRVIYCPTSYQYKTERIPWKFPVTMTYIDLPYNISVILDGPEATFSGPSSGYKTGKESNLDHHPTTATLRCAHCSKESVVDPSSRAYNGLLLRRSMNLITDLNVAKYSRQKIDTVSPLEKIKTMLRAKQTSMYNNFLKFGMKKGPSDLSPYCPKTPGIYNSDYTENRPLSTEEPEIVICKYDIEDIYGWGYISKTGTLDSKSGSYCVMPLEDVMLLNQQIKSWFGYDGLIRAKKIDYNYKILMTPFLYGFPFPVSGRSIDPRENAFDRCSMITAIENMTERRRETLKQALANPKPGCSTESAEPSQPEVKIEQAPAKEESTDIIRKLMTDRTNEILRQLSREGK